MADCEIQLSNWKAARKIYEEYVQQYAGGAAAPNPPVAAPGQPVPPPAGQPAGLAQAQERIEILKSLDRYQTLLADDQITRNKDDAQFQIGRIVLERMNNRVKAIQEFAKVVKNYPKSDQAAAAQFEVGKALLALGRTDDARAALLKVPAEYPTSPLAGDALYQVGQSYEQQASNLAGVTLEKARGIAFEAGQRGAYQEFQRLQGASQQARSVARDELRKGGQLQQLELEEAYSQVLSNAGNDPNLATLARKAEQDAETESALQVANRQDRINEANRQAVATYARAAKEYPLSTATSEALMRMAEIYEVQLKDRPSAMNTYQQIVKVFPGTPVAENAAWKVVKFYEQEGKFAEAVAAYRDFIRTYPASARVADAQYAMAEALEQLGRWVEAMDAYQTFREKFTTHPKASAAQEQIQWIKAYRK